MNICERRTSVEKTHIKQNIYPGIICIPLMTMSTIQNITAKRLEGVGQSLEKAVEERNRGLI